MVTDEAWTAAGNRVQDYYPYYGRGYVQLTHRNNYAQVGTRLRLPLVDDPDLRHCTGTWPSTCSCTG